MACRSSLSRSIAMTVRSLRVSPSSSSALSPPLSARRLPYRLPSFSSPFRPFSALGLQSSVTLQGTAISRLPSHMPVAMTACQQPSQAPCKVMKRQLTTVGARVGDKRNIRDYNRRLLASKYELRRKLYKALCLDPNLPADLRDKHRYKLSKLPRNSSFTRVRNRCIFSGRPRAVYRQFRTSRIVFRALASEGSLMGIKKASW